MDLNFSCILFVRHETEHYTLLPISSSYNILQSDRPLVLFSMNKRNDNDAMSPYPVVLRFSASRLSSKNRPLMWDLQEMLCADALAVSKSTLHLLTLGHTRAEIFFLPDACSHGSLPHTGRYYVESLRELAKVVLTERPYAKVRRRSCFFQHFKVETDDHMEIL